MYICRGFISGLRWPHYVGALLARRLPARTAALLAATAALTLGLHNGLGALR